MIMKINDNFLLFYINNVMDENSDGNDLKITGIYNEYIAMRLTNDSHSTQDIIFDSINNRVIVIKYYGTWNTINSFYKLFNECYNDLSKVTNKLFERILQ